MKIVKGLPPNYLKIATTLQNINPGVSIKPIFTYGRTIFNPSEAYLDPVIIAHEEVHAERQEKMGINNWWDRYLSDPAFRLEEESIAYRRQYRYAKKKLTDREKLSYYLGLLSADLASSMYQIPGLTQSQARKRIEQ